MMKIQWITSCCLSLLLSSPLRAVENTAPQRPVQDQTTGEMSAGYMENGNVWGLLFDVSDGQPEEYWRGTVTIKGADDYSDGNGEMIPYGYQTSQGILEWQNSWDQTTSLLLNMDLTRTSDVVLAGADMDTVSADTDKLNLLYQWQNNNAWFDMLTLGFKTNHQQSISDNYSLRTVTADRFYLPADSITNEAEVKLQSSLQNNKVIAGLFYQQADYDAVRWIDAGGMGGPGSGGQNPMVLEIDSFIWPQVDMANSTLYAEYQWAMDVNNRLNSRISYIQYEVDAADTGVDPNGSALSPAMLYALYYGSTETKDETRAVGVMFRYEHNYAGQNEFFLSLGRTPRWPDATERFVAVNSDTDENR